MNRYSTKRKHLLEVEHSSKEHKQYGIHYQKHKELQQCIFHKKLYGILVTNLSRNQTGF